MRSVEHNGSTWTVELLRGGTKVVVTHPDGGTLGPKIDLVVFREEAEEGATHYTQVDREITLASLSDEDLVGLLQRAQEEDDRR